MGAHGSSKPTPDPARPKGGSECRKSDKTADLQDAGGTPPEHPGKVERFSGMDGDGRCRIQNPRHDVRSCGRRPNFPEAVPLRAWCTVQSGVSELGLSVCEEGCSQRPRVAQSPDRQARIAQSSHTPELRCAPSRPQLAESNVSRPPKGCPGPSRMT